MEYEGFRAPRKRKKTTKNEEKEEKLTENRAVFHDSDTKTTKNHARNDAQKTQNGEKTRSKLEHAFILGWGIRGGWDNYKFRNITEEEWDHLLEASIDYLQGISTHDHSLMDELDLDGRRAWIGRRIWKAIR